MALLVPLALIEVLRIVLLVGLLVALVPLLVVLVRTCLTRVPIVVSRLGASSETAVPSLLRLPPSVVDLPIELVVAPIADPTPRPSLRPRIPFRLIASLFPPISLLRTLPDPLVAIVVALTFINKTPPSFLFNLTTPLFPSKLVVVGLLYYSLILDFTSK